MIYMLLQCYLKGCIVCGGDVGVWVWVFSSCLQCSPKPFYNITAPISAEVRTNLHVKYCLKLTIQPLHIIIYPYLYCTNVLQSSKDVTQLIYPPVDHKKVVDFLWDHLNTDINQLSAACGKSQDDCFFIMHMVLHNMISVQQSQQGKENDRSLICIHHFLAIRLKH